jgi:pimeloyl-ACP methyl ester carboxylesterase
VERRNLIGLVLCLLAACVLPAAAGAQTYAPLNQPGPPLSVSSSLLKASLVCEPSVAHAAVTPVLLNPATGVTAAENYSWNWEPALTKLGIPWCAYTAPNDTLNDIQTSGEYIVYAIRTMYALAGRKIDIMGHSQGGMSMRWALRFWPDTRAMVDDVIGFSGSNHGTSVLSSNACSGGCPAADWQQLYDSPFIEALNSDAETFAGISYTEIWTHTDEVVQPNGSAAVASAALHTGAGAITDVPTQQLCPLDVDEHLLIGTVDPVAYALAVDALQHPGPADVARTQQDNPTLCHQLYMPGVNPLSVNTYLQVLDAAPGLGSVEVGSLATITSGAPVLKSPPPLECYVYAACAGSAAPQLTVRIVRAPRRLRRGRRATVRVQVQTLEGTAMVPVPAVQVTFAGHARMTGAGGIATFALRFRRTGRYVLRARRQGCDSASHRLRVYR